ncbi:MAG: hypothetical protein HN576_05110 [Bacteriovoracaceae bacterium]|jgi:ABC-type phosphate transport system substrate-binding protein|nr:hypothetical protein [Bacteriovoracaceae bacterium]
MSQNKILILIILSLQIFSNTIFSAEFKIIVNKNSIRSEISKTELRQIYSINKTSWENNRNIVLAHFVFDSKLARNFSIDVLGKNAVQIQKFYLKKVFNGVISNVPYEAEDLEGMTEFVKANIGAIGYVSEKTSLKDLNEVKTIFLK